MFRFSLLHCLFFLLGPLSLSGQFGLPKEQLARVPAVALPAQDNAGLLARELAARRPGRANTFAVSLPVRLRPETAGSWITEGDVSVWRLQLVSPGAHSLNLGFSEYLLPPGAELYLATATEHQGPFVRADGEEHGRFWTPVLTGDRLLIELRVPTDRRDEVRLFLTKVNHDFEGINKRLSGDCNLDVNCGAANGFPIIEGYRDIIRSVAAFTLNGVDQCTGFLINNTNGDGRPFFMTADHCLVRADNAASVVAYWNYENLTCRPPDSEASGRDGTGNRTVFNSGTILRARSSLTDFTLLEFDDPVNPRADAFYAGWSIDDALPRDTLVTVHHPGVEEKRISFSFRRTTLSDRGGRETDPPGNFLRVPFWDLGTTEGGSSGAPLFDGRGRVRGQLFGGLAGCGNSEYDAFGFFSLSWTGNGTPTTRLADWLDPCGTGETAIDGLEQSRLPLLLTAGENCRVACVDDDVRFVLTLGEGYPAGTPLAVVGENTLGLRLASATAAGGESVALTYSGDDPVAPGVYAVEVRAGDAQNGDATRLFLELIESVALPPLPFQPSDGAADVDPSLPLGWRPRPTAESYRVEVALDADFQTIVYGTNGVAGNSLELPEELLSNTVYYWRVASNNACGSGAWSPTYTFTTSNLQCGALSAAGLPVPIVFTGGTRAVAEVEVTGPVEAIRLEVTVGIEHTYQGDLRATLIAPSGDSVLLFDPIQGGDCSAQNLYLIFADAAAAPAADLEASCLEGAADSYRAFRPRSPLADLLAGDLQGTWRLAVDDLVDLDGGEITEFSLEFCQEAGGGGEDLAVQPVTERLDGCANAGAVAQIDLGSAYTNELSLRVEADDRPLDNYTFEFDSVAGNLLTVRFSSWSLLGPGSYDLTFIVLRADGTARRATIPLAVSEVPGAALATDPSDGGSTDRRSIDFAWLPADFATGYTVEVAATPEFTAPLFTETTAATELTVDGMDFPDEIYWRTVASNGCGETAAVASRLNFFPLAVRDFGGGLEVNIYPNPTTDRLTVALSGPVATATLRAGLFDGAGRRVADFGQLRPGRQSLQLGHLPAGIYHLVLRSGSRVRTERIVVLP